MKADQRFFPETYDFPDDEISIMPDLVKKEMENVHKLNIPLKVDANYGKNWDEAH